MSESYGNYELVKKLATGGMAQIYLARRLGIEGFERLCVVKRILPHLAENEDFIHMFLDEAKIAARLNHPNIVSIHDLGAQDDSYYLAMEYIHGEDLRRVWKRADQQGLELPIPFVLRVIADAAAGLDYAHKRVDNGRPLNIVHRDISPQNILVSFEGGVKVVDFGIAKAADKATHTRSGVLKGKYSYMSPEQAAGSSDQPVDHRTDIFALGIVLYELLTGLRLFKRGNDIQTLTAVTECQVAPPSEVNARVPKGLDALVMQALQRDPEDRYQDAQALQLAIEGWLVQERLPSSTAHVAGFMHQLYADRLAEERSQGGVNPHAVPEIKSGEEEISPRGLRRPSGVGRPSRPSHSMRSMSPAGSEPSSREEATSSLRGPRSRSATGGRASGKNPTLSLRSSSGSQARLPRELPPESSPRVTEVSGTQVPGRSLKVAVGVAIAVGVAAIGVLLFRPGPSGPYAQVRVATEPPGATVIFNGQTLPGTTPTSLPPVPEGSYELRVGLARYRDQSLRVNVPAQGEVVLPTIALVPLSAGPHIPDAGPPVVVKPNVQVTFQTTPGGARLWVDGAPRGLTPATVALPPGAEVEIRAELARYEPLVRKLRVGDDAAQTMSWALTRVSRPTRPDRDADRVKDRDRDPDRVVRDPPRAMGTVRFAITPVGAWADVRCDGYHFGSTPFPDKQLPAGTYNCTFTNPELGTRKERVEVRPNGLQKVTVKFN